MRRANSSDVPALAHAADQALLERAEPALALPGGHRAPQLVGLARREARGDDRELHDLLLEDGHAERAFQHALDLGARVGDGLEAPRAGAGRDAPCRPGSAPGG